MPSKEVKKLIKQLEAQGFTCETSKRNHIKVFKDGKYKVRGDASFDSFRLAFTPQQHHVVKEAWLQGVNTKGLAPIMGASPHPPIQLLNTTTEKEQKTGKEEHCGIHGNRRRGITPG